MASEEVKKQQSLPVKVVTTKRIFFGYPRYIHALCKAIGELKINKTKVIRANLLDLDFGLDF